MKKRAFTLIELILVIVILGIISFMTLNMVFAIYKNYIQNVVVERTHQQMDIVLEQIRKRLDSRIRDSVIARKSSNYNEFISIQDENLDSSYDVLEFIPYSNELFNDGVYSGIVDMDVSSQTLGLVSPGSNLDRLNGDENTINDLSNGVIENLNKTKAQVAMIFKGVAYNIRNSFGYSGDTTNLDIAKVTKKNNTTFNINNDFKNKTISEQYHLAHTAYAIVTTENKTAGANRDFDLYLHYNYRPWLGERYTDNSTKKVLLAKNVSRFKFKGYNGMVLLKLCVRDNQKNRRSLEKSADFDYTICRTKAIY